MSREIKPCPFCGGDAGYQPGHTIEFRDSIWCIRCDFGMFDPDEQGSVITAWNRRAPVGAWQPIETAPTDVPHIRGLWVYRAKTGERLYWQTDAGVVEHGDFILSDGDGSGWMASDYTHWMPLSEPPTTCRKCGGEMRPGIATGQTYTGGDPDFPGDTHSTTFSAGGPGRGAECLKCSACGWSVTDGGETK